jgi:hypothetical protein
MENSITLGNSRSYLFDELVVAALSTGKLPLIAESFLELLRTEAGALRDA